ncbi:hypothetical protein HZI73_01545 [Vallitalea pronyensis]|uniref:Uncharacterized protein n=1 Tax=Vallitalea pronyensis TaxID=1348613 RepID=A0A8J8SF88_9FIRM|nr:hypothetical protein [Vallitalea pronyensis]QUI21059.1 hypothetical protein HZI73_01545 [Vallitalea pronyensis]
MVDKKYMEDMWRKIRWEEYERQQKEHADRVNELIRKEERKAKIYLFIPLTLIIVVVYIGLHLDAAVILVGGMIQLFTGIYYEQIIERNIIRRIKDENMY